MALAIAKAAPLRPEIKMSQALSEYEANLSAEQRQSYKKSLPDATAVMALTCEIDRQNAGRKTRRCGARLTSFSNSVKGFTAIVDLIIASSGNPIAGAVWGAVEIAIHTALGFETYFDSLSKLLMNVGLSSPRFEKYALLYPMSTSLQKELCNYYSVVINLCTRIVLFVRKPFIKQIASALRKPFDDEFGTFQKDLDRLGTAVKEEVSLASKQQQNLDSIEGARERKENSLFRATGSVFRRETANELGQARKWREGRIKSRLLNSCSRYNFETTLNQARKKGASTWILKREEYQQWRSCDSPSTLLCSGIVGSGKTVLCANLIEDLTLNKPLGSSLGYFFCKSEDAASLKAREVVGSLARQLFEDVPTETLKLNQMDPSIGDITLDIEQILSNMVLLLPRHKQYIMVLDGLDECEYEEIRVLVESIQSLLKSSKHIFKLFWTGRSDFSSRVSEQLRPDFEVHISPSNNGPEISKYIELALEDALESGRLKLRDPNVVLEIQDALEVEAHEMFLWVAFQIDSICAQNTDHDILNSLRDPPKGLPATFRRILSRLQHSTFADPSLGKKIFEIVAAAQRPLTLSELGEAISITPGDTAWNRNKLVNDVLKSLESCGSFIVVDEELSTVQFAHSSIKRHLLSEPTSLDIREYHIDPSRADVSLGSIAVTYLCLDALGNQLIKTNGPSQPYATNVPSFVVKSALPKHDVANRMALALLRGRKTNGNDAGKDLERSANLLRGKNTEVREVFSFLPYCQEYWLHHSMTIHDSGNKSVVELWEHLVNGTVGTVELPWAPENQADLGRQFLSWITKNRHTTLIKKAIEQLWFNRFHEPADLGSKSSAVFEIGQMEQLLKFLPNEDARRNLVLIPAQPKDTLLQEAVGVEYEAVVRLALQEGLDVNAQSEAYDNALYVTVRSGNYVIAQLLIENGADVNLQGGHYGSALQLAVAKNRNSIIELLLENGADVNARGGVYGTALIAAAKYGSGAMIRLLLEAGANVNAVIAHSERYGNALIAAVANDNLDAVSILLKAGALIDSDATNGDTLLRLAATRGTPDVVKMLLDNGASISWAPHREKVHEVMGYQ